MTGYKYLLLVCFAFCGIDSNAQATPEDLGAFFINSLKEDSIHKIDRLIPTLEELRILADKLGIDKRSKQYTEALDGYPMELEKFHENINRVYSDHFDNRLNWSAAKIEKITKFEDSLSINNKDQDKRKFLTTMIHIYFTTNQNRFLLILRDLFEIDHQWKTGPDISVSELTQSFEQDSTVSFNLRWAKLKFAIQRRAYITEQLAAIAHSKKVNKEQIKHAGETARDLFDYADTLVLDSSSISLTCRKNITLTQAIKAFEKLATDPKSNEATRILMRQLESAENGLVAAKKAYNDFCKEHRRPDLLFLDGPGGKAVEIKF